MKIILTDNTFLKEQNKMKSFKMFKEPREDQEKHQETEEANRK